MEGEPDEPLYRLLLVESLTAIRKQPKRLVLPRRQVFSGIEKPEAATYVVDVLEVQFRLADGVWHDAKSVVPCALK